MSYLLVFIVSILGTIMMKRLAIQDHPNERSSHTTMTPTGGGSAIVFAFYFGLVFLYLGEMILPELFYALLCGLVLAIVSFVDDIVELSVKFRLGVQLGSVLGAFSFLHLWDSTTWYMAFFFVISSLWLINLYNFLDGIDGYAGSEGIFVALGAYLFYHDSVLIMMVMAIGGFLLFNWQKASIFMGDVGSTFLGFFFSVMMVYHYHDSSDIVVWWILLGVFIFDASVTLLRRIRNRENFSIAHKKHAFQRLVQSGFSHQKVVLLGMGVNLFFLGFLLFFGASFYLFIVYNISLYILLKIVDKRSTTT